MGRRRGAGEEEKSDVSGPCGRRLSGMISSRGEVMGEEYGGIEEKGVCIWLSDMVSSRGGVMDGEQGGVGGKGL